MIQYSLTDCIFYLFFYSFIGWCAEVILSSIKTHHFVNRGFLNLPFVIPYGITSVILMLALPSLQHNLFLQFISCFIIFHIIWSLAEFFVQRICGLDEENTSNLPTLSWKSQLRFEIISSAVFLIVLLIVHPFIHGLYRMIPIIIIKWINAILSTFITIDFLFVICLLKNQKSGENKSFLKGETQNLAQHISYSIWTRLSKTYPGVEHSDFPMNEYTFAKGYCFDKLIWVFLVSSFLGALIEMCYCRIAGDIWMSRSSLLYGAFSVVWGAGAVVLTITLRPLAKKSSLLIFLSGFVIGGAYEYVCSIFTEAVFGTVFWDYSHMATSIGGRTNVVYCIFWGILAVVWIKLFYPFMSKIIELIPPLHGKIVTWCIIFVMSLNCILTGCAMIRYTDRISNPIPENAIESFMDANYDDAWMEHRWPNMKITNQ